jgi:hypothetical protein
VISGFRLPMMSVACRSIDFRDKSDAVRPDQPGTP